MEHDHTEHNHLEMVGEPIITEMQGMWALMLIMFLWNFIMQYQHRKLRDKVDYVHEDKKSELD